MSPDYWSRYPPHQTWGPPSPNSELPLEYRFEQMKLLGRIEAKVEDIQDDVSDLRADFNRHVETCNPPRRKTFELAKENWSILLTIGIVVLQYLLMSAGQPELANRLNSSVSPRQDFGDLSR